MLERFGVGGFTVGEAIQRAQAAWLERENLPLALSLVAVVRPA